MRINFLRRQEIHDSWIWRLRTPSSEKRFAAPCSTLPGEGHSFWLREDDNISLGDVPVELASWLENGFFESHRPGLPPCQGQPSQKALLRASS